MTREQRASQESSATAAVNQGPGAAPAASEPAGASVHGITPFQPTGPFPQVMLDLPTGRAVPLSATAHGERITLAGRVIDGAGSPLADTMIELWQADANGRYHHPLDPQAADADPGFWGYTRVATDGDGRFVVETIKPGRVAGPDGALQAPHILVSIFGGGILYRYVTRLYFDGELANDLDPVLARVPEARRRTLLATRDGAQWRFEIRLQGEGETVFFDF